jgi:hypothetical protein
MPSTQTLTDVKGCSAGVTENRAIHAAQPCAAGKPGKRNPITMHSTKRTTSVAEIAHPSATMLRGLFAALCVFMAHLCSRLPGPFGDDLEFQQPRPYGLFFWVWNAIDDRDYRARLHHFSSQRLEEDQCGHTKFVH